MSADALDELEREYFSRKMDKAQDGPIDSFAFGIVRSVMILKDRRRESGNDLPIKLHRIQEEWILNAVCNFNRNALKALLRAMDICEHGYGMHNPKAAWIILAHGSFTESYHKNPTLAELRKELKAYPFKFQMEDRTLRFICNKWQLLLNPDKQGRPSTKVGSKKKTTS